VLGAIAGMLDDSDEEVSIIESTSGNLGAAKAICNNAEFISDAVVDVYSSPFLLKECAVLVSC
jgi:hypothetical protein